jgi:hypothetical protein
MLASVSSHWPRIASTLQDLTNLRLTRQRAPGEVELALGPHGQHLQKNCRRKPPDAYSVSGLAQITDSPPRPSYARRKRRIVLRVTLG